jgi:hypothetical protein
MLDPTFTPHAALYRQGFSAQSLVESPGIVIERGNAHEDVGPFSEDSLLGEIDQPGSEPLPATVGMNADRLDVPDQGAGHTEDDETDDLLAIPGDVDLSGRVLHDPK